jgi:hypothetical protein
VTVDPPIEVSLRGSIPRLLDLAPVPRDAAGRWLALCEDGSIVSMGPDGTSASVVTRVSVPSQPNHKPWAGHRLRPRIHPSPLGTYAAIVNDYGLGGIVVETASGRTTMRLSGGGHHADTVPFSVAFLLSDSAELIVHRTDWNRLDVSDPSSGENLTVRTHEWVRTNWEDPRGFPPHHLDYFHGALHVSPDDRWLLDDGWIWAPVGAVVAWDAQRWMKDNVWESEDGPSLRRICGRAGYWGSSMCWIDGSTIAIGGLGDDADSIVEGTRIFDLTRPGTPELLAGPGIAEIGRFEGPSGPFFADGVNLFSAGEGGLSTWDLPSGSLLAIATGFRPTTRHPMSGMFAEYRPSSHRFVTSIPG